MVGEKSYALKVRADIEDANRLAEIGDSRGFEAKCEIIRESLINVGKEKFGPTWKPQKGYNALRILEDISLEEYSNNEVANCALNTLIEAYSPNSLTYTSVVTSIWEKKLNEQIRDLKKQTDAFFDIEPWNVVDPFHVYLDAMDKCAKNGNKRAIEQLCNLVVEDARARRDNLEEKILSGKLAIDEVFPILRECRIEEDEYGVGGIEYQRLIRKALYNSWGHESIED